MKEVTLRELHARTGQWVREASRCGQIVVTDNGRPIARIVPETDGAEPPYFAARRPSKAFRNLDRSGRTSRGSDATQGISQDREDRA
ncbi:MAG: type II toxin-antitoxin system prevent-host-death family antitoxin [Verrucomicrobiales bacterium]|nr:type II toxin-antitoxin system prevent-host-death family antitoxin [Verrucomicrobiales bacterium]